jgi:Ca-activated chloride channel family protein
MKPRRANSSLVAVVIFSFLSGLFSQAVSQSKQPQLDQSLLSNPDLISVRFSVVDSHGRFVAGLPKDTFDILDNTEPQTIISFSNTDSPMSVGIIFDASDSMSDKSIQEAREGVVNFIQMTDPRHEFFALAFNSETRIESTRDPDAIRRALVEWEPNGATSLLDSVYLAAEKIQHSRYDRRVLFLITDGRENPSRYKLEDVRRILQQSGVMLYAIGIVEGVSLPSKAGFHIQTLLNDLSEPTGGGSFFPQSKKKLQETFDKIAQELRSQYSIGYKPANVVRDVKWHKVIVRLNVPQSSEKLKVVGKTSHFARPRGY